MKDGAGGLRFFTLNCPEAPNPFGVAMIEAIILDIGPEILHGRDWSAAILDSPRQVRPVGEGDVAASFFDVLHGVNRWTIQSKESNGIPIWARKLSTGPCVPVDLRRRTRLGMRLDVILPPEAIQSAARQIVTLLARERKNGSRSPWEQPPTTTRMGRRESSDMQYRASQRWSPSGQQSVYFAK